MLDSMCNMARQNDTTEQQQVSQWSLVTVQETASSCCADRLGAKSVISPQHWRRWERQTYSRLAHDWEEKGESAVGSFWLCAHTALFRVVTLTNIISFSFTPRWRQTRREMSKLTQATSWRAGKNRKSAPRKHHRKVSRGGNLGDESGSCWHTFAKPLRTDL